MEEDKDKIIKSMADALEQAACTHDRLGIRILELENHIKLICGKSKDGCPSIITNCSCCKCILNPKNKK
jgi:hypothetical protein